ncbi:nitroreductase [Alcaligenaceae bacterium C4P045]|nr:nitroreductase [Alcaligenaceae bacterium C4P045]
MTSPTIETLLTRRSTKAVCEPAPKPKDLKRIMQAAVCAPDHGGLQPWRFAVIRGEARARFADMMMEAVKRSGDKRMTAEKEKSVRAWIDDVPVLIAIAQHIDHDNTKIPESERLLAVGASVMNMLNAAHALGYGAFWSTGLGTYVEDVQDALGFDALDYKFLGFLAVGTLVHEMKPIERTSYKKFFKEWTGPHETAPLE